MKKKVKKSEPIQVRLTGDYKTGHRWEALYECIKCGCALSGALQYQMDLKMDMSALLQVWLHAYYAFVFIIIQMGS